MKQHAPPVRGFLGAEFNPFLFASIGPDQRGGQLSVVSALARLDLDAWAEAASLARLPKALAVAKLAELIRRATELPTIAEQANKIATRLVALLPDRTPFAALPRQRGVSARVPAAIFFICLLTALLFGAQLLNPPSHAAAPGAASASPQ